jgi:hypothetical protein
MTAIWRDALDRLLDKQCMGLKNKSDLVNLTYHLFAIVVES